MKGIWPALALTLCAGCMVLSTEERVHLGRLEERGYSVASPPAGFEAPVEAWTVAGLNVLPGIGNFYLAAKGGPGWQWAMGVGNLLLWPISPLWAVPEGGMDARTLNERALLAYCRGLTQESRNEAPREGGRASGGKGRNAPGGDIQAARRADAKPEKAKYEIVTEEAFSGGRAVFRVDIRDNALTAFQIVREVRPEIEQVLRDAFAAETPGVEANSLRVYVVPEFCADRSIRFRGWAFAVRPLAADGWQYDPKTHRGKVRLRISEGMPAEESKRWARENIAAIVREKNVALETDKTPPPNVLFQSLSESLENGVLTVEFEAME